MGHVHIVWDPRRWDDKSVSVGGHDDTGTTHHVIRSPRSQQRSTGQIQMMLEDESICFKTVFESEGKEEKHMYYVNTLRLSFIPVLRWAQADDHHRTTFRCHHIEGEFQTQTALIRVGSGGHSFSLFDDWSWMYSTPWRLLVCWMIEQ